MKGHDTLKRQMHGTPLSLAGMWASQIESDPVMAALIKEHIPAKRLVQLLDLKADPYFRLPLLAFSTQELEAEVARRQQNAAEEHHARPLLDESV